VDEKTAIQALDRLDPVLPLSPGRAERHGFEYFRHGTLSLYAALDVKTGKVTGKTARRHTSADFIAFLTGMVQQTKWAKEIHIVLDNLSAHKTKAVEEFAKEPAPPLSFHSHLLLLAQPSRTLVRQDSARRHRPRRLHLGQRSGSQTPPLHPRLPEISPPFPLDLHRPSTSNQS
jgi:transposase